MLGNVWEWCQDRYSETYYAESPEDDPRGADTAQSRILRGGSFNFSAPYCRCAFRNLYPPLRTANDVGFRVVLRRADAAEAQETRP